MSRRLGRFLVLAVLVAAFLGPWEATPYPHQLRYFPWVVKSLLRSSDPGKQVVLAALVATPSTCLVAALMSTSLLLAIVYRALAGGTLVLLGPLAWGAFASSPREEVTDAWGFGLYLVGLALAIAIEVIPPRRVSKRSCANVFR